MPNVPVAISSSTQPIHLFGLRLIGINPQNGKKLLITFIVIVSVVALNWALRGIAKLVMRGRRSQSVVFWVRQGISVLLTLLVVVSLLSIWFDNPARLATFAGLVSAGVAFALQKPISALAGYLVILRGGTFSVGDRITMGGVRGDVIALRFTQTAIMEMGVPSESEQDSPGGWIHGRQYTGRIVTVSNSLVFDEPVYNYTKEFSYVWEELRLPIPYGDDRVGAEQILLEAAKRHTVQTREMSQDDLKEFSRRYFIDAADLLPRVYWRITDNWLELTVRFIAHSHNIRELKDAMTRDIMPALDEARIRIGQGT